MPKVGFKFIQNYIPLNFKGEIMMKFSAGEPNG